MLTRSRVEISLLIIIDRIKYTRDKIRRPDRLKDKQVARGEGTREYNWFVKRANYG